MKPIAIFYHVYMGGGSVPVMTDNAIRIVSEQLGAMKHSGLTDAACKVLVGVSGSPSDYMAVNSMACDIVGDVHMHHNLTGVGELPTMRQMQEWAKCNPEHYICYLHTKGVIHNCNPIYEAWRMCMERVVIGMWKDCAKCLECGYDGAGAHWLTPGMYPFIGDYPYWGGNFFWARADHLNKLPEVDIHADRYQAEVWFGKSPRWPRVRDYARHFPMSGCHL